MDGLSGKSTLEQALRTPQQGGPFAALHSTIACAWLFAKCRQTCASCCSLTSHDRHNAGYILSILLLITQHNTGLLLGIAVQFLKWSEHTFITNNGLSQTSSLSWGREGWM